MLPLFKPSLNFPTQSVSFKMPAKRRRNGGRKSKFVTKRGLPFQLMKYAETKYHTIGSSNITLTVPPSGDSVNPLYVIRRGSAEIERTGNEISISGVYIRIIAESALVGSAQYLRAVLYTPRTPQSMLPVVPDSGMTTFIDPDLFVVWFDKTMLVTFTPGGGAGVMVIRKKFKPYMKAIYDQDLGTLIQRGPLLLGLFGKNNLGTNVTFTGRLYFKDL